MKYILGGGVAGLVSAFYLPEHYLITDKIGGWQNKNTFQLGPRLLEVTPATTTFLKKLNLPIEEKKIFIGYRAGDFTGSANKTPEFAKKYALKTREHDDTIDALMSGNKDTLVVFDIEYDLILKKLEEKVQNRIILDKVTSIYLQGQSFRISKDPKANSWDELVNTLPLNLFCKLSNFEIERDFTAFNTTFLKVKSNEYTKFFYKIYDYIYSIDTMWHRCNIFKDHAVLEVKGKLDTSLNGFDGFEVLDKITIPSAQMKYSYNDLAQIIPNILNVGRYAQWNHSIKMEQIIEKYERTKTDI